MKKVTAILLAMMIVVAMTACGSKPQETTNAPETTAAPASAAETSAEPADPTAYKEIEETYLSMAAGASGGGWYIMGAAMNDVFEQNMNVHMTLIPGGGSTNPTLVNDGADVQIGFTYISNAAAAKAGQFDYAGSACTNLRGLACLNINQYLTITSTSSDFVKAEDFVNNASKLKIGVGPRGGGNEVMLNRYLEGMNTSLDDLASKGASVQYVSVTDGLNGIKDGNLNTANYLAAAPLAALVEALASVEMHFITLDPTVAQHAVDTYGYTYTPIPAGTYQYQDGEVGTLCDTVVLVVNAEVDDAVAFNLAKALAENIESLLGAHASFAAMDPNVMAQCGIELHPGAAEYYTAAGLMK